MENQFIQYSEHRRASLLIQILKNRKYLEPSHEPIQLESDFKKLYNPLYSSWIDKSLAHSMLQFKFSRNKDFIQYLYQASEMPCSHPGMRGANLSSDTIEKLRLIWVEDCSITEMIRTDEVVKMFFSRMLNFVKNDLGGEDDFTFVFHNPYEIEGKELDRCYRLKKCIWNFDFLAAQKGFGVHFDFQEEFRYFTFESFELFEGKAF